MRAEEESREKKKERLTKQQALPKIRQFCAYQERCHSEVKEKLYGYGLRTTEVDELISSLIEENYLNEERFAVHFAGGKFRMKKWGRVKIRYELKSRQVSDYCIKKAMKEIPEEGYYNTLVQLAEKKWEETRGEKNVFVKRRKVQDLLLQKGFEAGLVREAVQSVSGERQ